MVLMIFGRKVVYLRLVMIRERLVMDPTVGMQADSNGGDAMLSAWHLGSPCALGIVATWLLMHGMIGCGDLFVI
jgi:hypothetical protein